MPDDELTTAATEPDPEYVDTTPAEPDDVDEPEPMQDGETDPAAEIPAGTEP